MSITKYAVMLSVIVALLVMFPLVTIPLFAGLLFVYFAYGSFCKVTKINEVK